MVFMFRLAKTMHVTKQEMMIKNAIGMAVHGVNRPPTKNTIIKIVAMRNPEVTVSILVTLAAYPGLISE